MALPIISAEQRLSEPRGIKGCIFGKSGIGKTSLLWTLPEKTTLFVDLEAGDLAIEGWRGHTMRPRTWEECRDFAVLIGGADPAMRDLQNYSQQHFEFICKKFNIRSEEINAYDTVFIDSITVAARLCFTWCKRQPEVYNDKTKKVDLRGAYGMLAQEMLAWLIHLQHTRNKNIWFLGILDEKTDDFNRRYFEPQIEGTKTGLELPGIVDQVITMADIDDEINEASGGPKYRAFVCHTINSYGYPAKDRSGRLDCIESPDLGKFMTKLKTKGRPLHQRLNYTCPDLQPQSQPQPQHLGE